MLLREWDNVLRALEQTKMLRKIHGYGWNPQHPDKRDWIYEAPKGVVLPSSVTWEKWGPVIYDQGQLGSCTGNGIARAIQFDQIKEHLAHIYRPSRLQIYYNERVMEGTVSQDAGAMIRDGIKSVNVDGVAPEYLWPYDISKFADVPPASVVAEGRKHPTLIYRAVQQTADQMRGCVAACNHIVIGFTVYESFESQAVASTGEVPMPKSYEQVLGGHCVCVIGYDDATRRFLCANSWGTSWGRQGYFTMPYDYLLDSSLASDFWIIQSTR